MKTSLMMFIYGMVWLILGILSKFTMIEKSIGCIILPVILGFILLIISFRLYKSEKRDEEEMKLKTKEV